MRGRGKGRLTASAPLRGRGRFISRGKQTQKQTKDGVSQTQTGPYIYIDQSRRTIRSGAAAVPRRTPLYTPSVGSTVVMPQSYPNPYQQMHQQMFSQGLKQPNQIKEIVTEVSKEFLRNARNDWLNNQQIQESFAPLRPRGEPPQQPSAENSVAVGNFDDFNDFPMDQPILPEYTLDRSISTIPPRLNAPSRILDGSQSERPYGDEKPNISFDVFPKPRETSDRVEAETQIEEKLARSFGVQTSELQPQEQPDINELVRSVNTKSALTTAYINARAKQYKELYNSQNMEISDAETKRLARRDYADQFVEGTPFKNAYNAFNTGQVAGSREKKKGKGGKEAV